MNSEEVSIYDIADPGSGVQAGETERDEKGLFYCHTKGVMAAAAHARPEDPSECGPDYWRTLCPWLHVDDKTYQDRFLASASASPSAAAEGEDYSAHKQRLVEEGYTTMMTSDTALASRLARCALRLRQCGWPASFMIMYDEVFALSHCVDRHMIALTGRNSNNGDMLAWFIDPNNDEAGFSPHRDRQPENPAASFFTDSNGAKMPCYSTAWVALTNATPENSCLYVVPAQHDPGYYDGDLDTVDPLQRCIPDKTGWQNIRAVPVQSGDAVFFSHRILHWGSRGRKGFETPRIALSVACANDAFEPCFFDREALPFPPPTLRMALVCAQMVCYHERFRFTAKDMHFFASVFRSNSSLFTVQYRAKVLKDLIPAIEEATKRDADTGLVTSMISTPKVSCTATSDWHTQSDEEEDDLDAALMQMLDAAADGGEDGDLAFHDDFDAAGEGVAEPDTKKQRTEMSRPGSPPVAAKET